MQHKLFFLRKFDTKMTQSEVAEYLGISIKTYRDKEKGNAEFTQDEMFALSELFQCGIEDIFLPRTHQNGNKKL